MMILEDDGVMKNKPRWGFSIRDAAMFGDGSARIYARNNTLQPLKK